MGGGGGEDNSAELMAQQNELLLQAVKNIQAQQEQDRKNADDANKLKEWQDDYKKQQAQWQSQLNAQNEAMQRIQDDASRKAQEMQAQLAAEAAEQARLVEEARQAAEQSDKLTTMKTGMASGAASELEVQNTLKKRRAGLTPLSTLLTGGQGDTTAAPTQAKTLLGQ